MADILFIAHRIPYPPNKGDKIRSWNILAHLLQRHRVHLGCFIDDPADLEHRGFLDARCATTCYVTRHPKYDKLRSTLGFLTGDPLSLRYYDSRQMRDWVARTLRAQKIDAGVAICSTAAPYVAPYAAKGLRTLIDFIDIDSDKWRQYAENRSWPMSAVYRREARTLLAFERQAAAAFDVSLFVSEAEAEMFRGLAPEAADKVFALENGVDLDAFDRDRTETLNLAPHGPVIVFTGAMDYWANVDAVTWFADRVWPQILTVHPGAAFYIVGGKPTAAVQALAKRPGIVVTGRVPLVQPYLKAADIAVAPMRIARGIQNKVLEAMAMAAPTLASPQGFEGIDATPGDHLMVAGDAAEFAATALELLRDKERARQIGMAGRRQVVARYAWDATLAPLDQWITDGHFGNR